MSVNSLAWAGVLGILPLLFLPQIPVSTLLWWGVVLSTCVISVGYRHAGIRFVALVTVSFCWALLNAQTLLLQIERITQDSVHAVVTISSIRFSEHSEASLTVRLEEVNQQRIFPPLYAQLILSPAMENWCGGQRWAITANFRPIHSRLNEGGFDSQRWAVAKRQPLSGRVLTANVLDGRCDFRQRTITQAEQQVQGLPWRSILLALTFGEMKTVSTELKALLQNTGTMHLMAISGLHIVLAGLVGWGMARGLQYGFPVTWISYRFPLLMSAVAAWGYVWLAGGNPPAVRSALALSVWVCLKVRSVNCSAWQVWLWCVALILVSDPLSVLSDSFWLSCLAVASLIFWFQWAPLPHRLQIQKRWFWLRWIHLQTGITLLLVPLQLHIFHGFSATSLPANLWAVPLVSFVTTPLILLALSTIAFAPLSEILWWLADISLRGVFAPLTYLQTGWIYLDASLLLASIAGWGAVVVWRFSWWRTYPASVGILILVLLVFRIKRDEPDWRVDMLDVGHGLAIVIEQRGKAVLYDTGNRWEGGDMATREILPYLRWRGVDVENIILSHSHMDHIGGLETLQTVYPKAAIYSAIKSINHRPCLRGEHWRWQGLTFTVLWPLALVERAENNDSCVIRVDDGKYRVLLTGDLEADAEKALIKLERSALHANLLQIPHHGSKTSSSPPFIRAVNAELAMASTARYNPWRLPAIKIVERYRQYGYSWQDTASFGQLSARFFSDSWHVLRFRDHISPRWYHQWFGVKRYNE
ncbi:competence protein ComEC [Pectobacterium betavasculorum]|uniref:Competence protein ComEC n=1 Tax=Pectobacterium betavasculorum TaxID=55207 RepID=A0A093VPK9_9GAMM|nr:ComEC family protein [Pectobacterium betavasculorum]KFX07141.1 competence protein ComEC [Pectobacterium betavasculorum]KFX22493.1 competence protein ComEC [Pectobacterium betavasculorum]